MMNISASKAAQGDGAQHGEGGSQNGAKAQYRRSYGLDGSFERWGLVVTWAVVVAVFSFLPETSSTFPTFTNFSGIFGSQAVIVVLTLGLLIPLTAGDYDLSIASVLTLSAMVIAVLNVNHHWPIGFAVLAALGVGITVGAVNGGVVVLFGIDPFIVTLGTGTFLTGVVQWISGSNTISGVSQKLVKPVIVDRLFNIPLAFYYGLVVCLLLVYFLEFMPAGRRLLFVGQSRTVALLSGIRVKRMRWGALVASGLISAIAGVIYAGTSGAADPNSGTSLLLPAYAAAFLGATAIIPGRFNAIGSLVAVYFLVTGINGLQLLGVDSFVQDMFYGAALVVAVAVSQVVRRRQVVRE